MPIMLYVVKFVPDGGTNNVKARVVWVVLHQPCTPQVNYRPPSDLGINIPTSENIYNADPSQPLNQSEW